MLNTPCVNGLARGQFQARCTTWQGRLNGFEILVGPYAVAHLRISQRLRDVGVTECAAQDISHRYARISERAA